MEAVRSSARTSDAVSRVLRIPVAAEVRSGRTLTNLSTAARIRCFEVLAAKPPDWLVKDMDTADAYRRWMIVAAGGHDALIKRFADYLNKHQARRRSSRRPRPPGAELADLLTAYVRVAGHRTGRTNEQRGQIS
ncbi:hypothetical protein [Neoaquamicrobium sediminum]|uniref:hypothetical protein n=1 Tax=Neoaquamicrobium sediminum TaxID=1849104 RepID=UPI001FD45D66|nr:hypothetical protein [Mesorhizobium sediminum]